MPETVREHLSPKQEKAIAALITSKTLEEAAQKVGVHPRTLHRWRAEDPLFEVEYRSARRQALDEGVASLQAGLSEAVTVLRECLSERNPHVRIRAALGLIEHGLAAHASFELDERLKALEGDRGEEYSTSC